MTVINGSGIQAVYDVAVRLSEWGRWGIVLKIHDDVMGQLMELISRDTMLHRLAQDYKFGEYQYPQSNPDRFGFDGMIKRIISVDEGWQTFRLELPVSAKRDFFRWDIYRASANFGSVVIPLSMLRCNHPDHVIETGRTELMHVALWPTGQGSGGLDFAIELSGRMCDWLGQLTDHSALTQAEEVMFAIQRQMCGEAERAMFVVTLSSGGKLILRVDSEVGYLLNDQPIGSTGCNLRGSEITNPAYQIGLLAGLASLVVSARADGY